MEANVRDLWGSGEAFVPECPSCAGRLDRSARGLLSWAQMSARTRAESRFWELAQVSEVIDGYQGDDRADPPVQALARHVSDVTKVAQHRTEALGQVEARGLASGVWWSEEVENDAEESEKKPPELTEPPELTPREKELVAELEPTVRDPSGRPKGEIVGYEKFCCCDPFGYTGPMGPVFLPFGLLSEDGKKQELVGAQIEFELDAHYSDQGTCDCACCELRQWIIVDEYATWPAPSSPHSSVDGVPMKPKDVETKQGEVIGEDCAWGVWNPAGDDGKGGYEPKRSKSKPTPLPGTPDDKPVLGPYCFGNKEHAGEMAEKGGKLDQRIGECDYWMYDGPIEGAVPPAWLRWQLRVVAVVYDRCHNWKIMRIDDLESNVEAYLGTSYLLSWGSIVDAD